MNLIVKQVRRVAFGFRKFTNYRLRVLLRTGGVSWWRMPTPSFVYPPHNSEKFPICGSDAHFEERLVLRRQAVSDGLSASFSIIDRNPDTQIAQIVQSQLAKIGVKLTVQVLERTTWVNTWTSKQGEIGLLRSGGCPTSPSSSVLTNMDPSSSGDFAAYSSPEMPPLEGCSGSHPGQLS